MTTEVKQCKCEHKFQDKEYGANQRLHNVNSKGETTCTVCGKSTKKSK